MWRRDVAVSKAAVVAAAVEKVKRRRWQEQGLRWRGRRDKDAAAVPGGVIAREGHAQVFARKRLRAQLAACAAEVIDLQHTQRGAVSVLWALDSLPPTWEIRHGREGTV